MTYSTEELIRFIELELRATWKGERIIFSGPDKLDNPVVAKAIDVEKANKVFVFRDFRQQIHKYQQENQVSGIVWRKVSFNNKTLRFPEVHNQLIPIEGDKEILSQAKESVLDFWSDITQNMKYYLAGDRLNPVLPTSLVQFYREAEWAEIDTGIDEVYLGLCWGHPQEYIYQWARPKSGYHRIIAAFNEPSSINI
jgi:hypothetical protein